MHIREFARRHRAPEDRADEPSLEALRDDTPRAPHGLPDSWVRGIRTFYDDLHADGRPRGCGGTACTFAGARPETHPVYCLGRCYEAPAHEAKPSGPIPRVSLAAEPVVLRHLLGAEPDPFADYLLPDGTDILEAVAASGLRGRGGAAYPTANKWRVARQTPAPDRYVVCNGDEGDPGAYVDRLLLEESPHAVLAGMLACARAIGASRGILFIRGEYPVAAERARAAVDEAMARGLLGDFQIRVLRGAGSYVAGEETALLRAIEGLRAEPWVKPPYPAERGLEDLPTIVQNVETLAIIPWIVRGGGRANQKAICLSGAVQRPGIYEIELGMTLRHVLEAGGGGAPAGRRWKMALVGGPMGRVVPAKDFDVPLSYEGLSGMGHGGVVVLDDTVHARRLAEHLFAFAAAESCGNCAPCRIGTAQLASRPDRASLERLMETLEIGSLCGFGQGVPRPLHDLLAAFPEEMFPC
jgi:NADH:ubiquinone oxidoreductase subunit F (NADH-binding)